MADAVADYLNSIDPASLNQPPQDDSIVSDYLSNIDPASLVQPPASDSISEGLTRGIGGLEKSAGGLVQATSEAPISAIQQLSQPEDPNAPWYDKYLIDPAKSDIAKVKLASTLLPALLGTAADPTIGQDIRKDADLTIAKNTPAKTSLAGQVAEMVPGAAGYIAGGVLGGVPAVMGMAGAQTYGDKYAEARDKGQSPNQADTTALPYTGLSAATAAIPVKTFGMGESALAHAAGGAGGFDIQNIANTIGDLAIHKLTDKPNMTWDEAYTEAKKEISDNFLAKNIVGAAGGSVAHLVTGGAKSETKPAPTTEPRELPQQIFNPQSGQMEDAGGPPNPPAAGAITPIQDQTPVSPTVAEPPPTPSITDDLNAGNINSDQIRDLVQQGKLIFKDGKLQEPEAPPSSVAPTIDGTAIVNAINSGNPNISSDQVREYLSKGIIRFNEQGKLEATPRTADQALAIGKLSADTGNILGQQNAQPLLGAPDAATATLQKAQGLRAQSLDNLVSQLKTATSSNLIDDTNAVPKKNQAYTAAVNDFYLKNQVVNKIKDGIGAENTPIAVNDIPNSNTDNVKANLDAIATRNPSGLDTPVLHDLIDNGFVKINDAGHPEMTGDGQKLHQALQPVLPEIAPETKALPSPDQFPTDVITADTQGNAKPQTESDVADIQQRQQQAEAQAKQNEDIGLTPDVAKAQADRAAGEGSGKQFSLTSNDPVEAHLADLEREHDSLPDGSPRKDEIVKEMGDIVEKRNAEQPKLSVTDEFSPKKQMIANQVTNIIKRINPDIDVKLVKKMFGEGEAVKASGGKSTDKQEVAGSYEKLKNLVTASLNTAKWNPLDTAYHEAYHSVRDMINPNDDAILKKAFPGTDKLSQEEHEAVQFGKYMTEKNAPGFTAAVKRVFGSIKQALTDIGNSFRKNKLNSVEDIFNRVERGSVYKDYVKSVKDADIEKLKASNLSPEQQKQAVREASPALAEAVYSATPKDDEGLDRLNKENNGTPTEKAYALGKSIFDKAGTVIDKGLDQSQAMREKMMRTAVEAGKPFMSETDYKKKVADNEANIAKLKREKNDTNAIQTARDLANISMASIDGFGRSLAKRYKSNTIQGIMDMFHPDPGSGRSVGETYHEEITANRNKVMSKVNHLLDGFSPAQMAEVRDYMVNPEKMAAGTPPSKTKNAAANLARMIQDMRESLKQAGVEIPEVQGFFPRDYDNAYIVKNEMAFKKDARLAYIDTYPEAKGDEATLSNMVEKWYNNILLQDNGILPDPDQYFRSVSTTPPSPNSMKSRTLSKAADNILADYMVKDPLSAMNRLAAQTARKVAWEKRFGDDKLKIMHSAMDKEGVDGVGIQHVMDIIRANTGQLGGNVNQTLKNGLALARYVTAISYLAKAPLKHLSISANVGLHTGSLKNALRAFQDSTIAFHAKSDKARTMQTFGELAGVYGEAAEHAMLMNQIGGNTQNERINYLTRKYFDATGMTHLVGSSKLGMMRPIQYYIADMANDIVNHTNSYKSSEFMTKNYGVPAEEVQNFAKWVQDGGGKAINQSLVLDGSKYSQMYQVAMRRAIDQMISNPTPATRQMYASHPVGNMIYGLTAYHMAFMKNSMQRAGRMAAQAINPSNGFSGSDRWNMIKPLLATIPVMTAFAYGYNSAKNAIFPPDKKDKNSPLVESVLDADLFGPFNELMKTIAGTKTMQKEFGYKYHSFASNQLGPTASLGQNYWDMVKNLGDNFSGNQKAKQAELKAEYNLVFAPTMTSFTSTFIPYAIPRFAAVEAINASQARQGVVNTLK